MSLHDLLVEQIAANGPMRVSDFMTDCLLHPEYGYYTTQDPFGASGDFITAPEISQMFGELIGLSLAQSWMDQSSPTVFTLAEFGPGRGTLMADILRATKGVSGFHDAASIVLIEASPKLRAQQSLTLAGYDPQWIDNVEQLGALPTYAVANEFFDALPIRQFIRDGIGWRERQIGISDDALAFGLSAISPQPALAHRIEDTKDGDLVEECTAATAIIGPLGQRIKDHGGAALIIDYGDWRSLGDTLQALKNHAPVDPLLHAGQADLTAHVDFEALANACPCAYSRVTPQGVFLERLGITQRAQTLAQNMEADTLKAHVSAHKRLTHPDEMGNLFKVMGLYPEQGRPPAGLEP
jgi:NADH dehydrogenase [ubiquinone] 1 alpha subcomplex assembly factor 7